MYHHPVIITSCSATGVEATPTVPVTILWLFQTMKLFPNCFTNYETISKLFSTAFHRRTLKANPPTQALLSLGSTPGPPSLCVAFVYCHSHFHLQVALLQVMGTPGVSEQDPEKLHQLKIK